MNISPLNRYNSYNFKPLFKGRIEFDNLLKTMQNPYIQQGASSDCYLLCVLGAMMNNEKGREKIYSCFSEDGDDVIVKFPKGNTALRFKNAQLRPECDELRLLEGDKGLKMLE